MARLALQQAALTAADGAAADFFGWSVALSGDTAVVGAFGHTTPARERGGAAFVFTRSAGIWTLQAQLNPTISDCWDNFGQTVAISGDTALVGAPSRDTDGKMQGAGTGQVRRREGHGDDHGRREQRQELHGEALTVCGARRGQRTRVSAGLTASAGVRARRNPSGRPPTAA